MARGRPKGSKNRPKTELTVVSNEGVSSPGNGHNSDLTDDEAATLHFHHVGEYEKALAAKKSADADLRNVAKRIKAEGGSVTAVKSSILLKTPEGEEKFKAEYEQMQLVARWNNLPIGTQGDIFDVDRRPLEERAYNDGKIAGGEGKTLSIPAQYAGVAEAANAYVEGHKASQAILANKIKPTATVLRDASAPPPSTGAAAELDDDSAALAGSADTGDPWPDDAQIAASRAAGTAPPPSAA